MAASGSSRARQTRAKCRECCGSASRRSIRRVVLLELVLSVLGSARNDCTSSVVGIRPIRSRLRRRKKLGVVRTRRRLDVFLGKSCGDLVVDGPRQSGGRRIGSARAGREQADRQEPRRHLRDSCRALLQASFLGCLRGSRCRLRRRGGEIEADHFGVVANEQPTIGQRRTVERAEADFRLGQFPIALTRGFGQQSGSPPSSEISSLPSATDITAKWK